jgi:hypothetical protein
MCELRWFIPVVLTVQLNGKNIQCQHNYLFPKEISNMFWIKYVIGW